MAFVYTEVIEEGGLFGDDILKHAKQAKWMISANKNKYLAYPKAVTRGWDHRMVFDIRVLRSQGDLVLEFGARGSTAWLWALLNKGAKPRVIRAKKGKTLRFRLKYASRTKAPRQYGGSGKSSGKYVYAKKVNHPGFKPRRFNEEWQKRSMKELGKWMSWFTSP